jgi:hypothetical protein
MNVRITSMRCTRLWNKGDETMKEFTFTIYDFKTSKPLKMTVVEDSFGFTLRLDDFHAHPLVVDLSGGKLRAYAFRTREDEPDEEMLVAEIEEG